MSSKMIEMDLSSELHDMGYQCGYSCEGDPAKEFFIKVKGGEIDLRAIVIAEQYGYHFNNAVKLMRPQRRKNTDVFDIHLVFNYDPDAPRGRWRQKNTNPKIDNFVGVAEK